MASYCDKTMTNLQRGSLGHIPFEEEIQPGTAIDSIMSAPRRQRPPRPGSDNLSVAMTTLNGHSKICLYSS
jgi:hypothetical protein